MNDLIINNEFEEYLIEKLKVICGINYVNMIEGIISDSKSQYNMNTNYSLWLGENPRELDEKKKIQTNVCFY